MKKTIATIAASLLIFWACGGGGGSDIVVTPTPEPPIILPPEPDPKPEPEPEPGQDPEPEQTVRTIFIYDATKPEIGTSDGINYYQMTDGHAANARGGFVAIGDILHGVDNTGQSIITSRLPVVPDAIAISGDIWSFKIINDTHTKIFKGSDEYGDYLDNQWVVSDAVAMEAGDIVAIDDRSILHSATEPALNIRFAAHNGIMIHSLDVTNHRAYIRGYGYDTLVAFNTNYFFGADQWVEADGIWYSWNGYTWDGSVLAELSTSLSDFVLLWYAERPILAAVGSRIEHGEDVTYWIECNTGWLYRHTPSINALEQVIHLWQGPGTRSDGIVCAGEIKPVLTDNNLFFGWNGTIWKYNFNDALVSSFAAGVEIWKL